MIFKITSQTPETAQQEIRRAAQSLRLAQNMTQVDLAERSGVPLSTLKRFEQSGEVSLASLLAIAGAMDALDAFGDLFPKPQANTLDELDSVTKDRKRARAKRS